MNDSNAALDQGESAPQIDDAAAVRALCSQLFAEPQRLVKAHAFPTLPASSQEARPRMIGAAPHAHADLLQLDLALGCCGHWIVEGHKYEIKADTLMVFYPHQYHAYQVRSVQTNGRVLSVKIRVDNSWPLVTARSLEPYRAAAEQLEALISSWERLIWLFNAPLATQATSLTAQMLRLSEVLALWPRRGEASETASLTSNDLAVEAALRYLETHLNRVVPLEELAHITHISPRHLMRRFQVVCGQSPRAYAEARRLDAARDWLLRETHSVSHIAHHLGFSSLHAFSRWFKMHNGASPRTWQREASTRPSQSRVPFQ